MWYARGTTRRWHDCCGRTPRPAEPGCLEFSVYQEIDDPRAFLLYERYTSEEAFQAHRRTPHFEDIIERQVVPLLDERAWTRMEPLPN
jgi:quinol monooxygenase YgiN